MNPNEVSKIIEKARKEKGLTQNQLADKLGVSNTAISKWENGYNLPDISMFEPINKVLDIDMFSIINIQKSASENLDKAKKIKRKHFLKNIIIIFLIFILLLITNLLTYLNINKEITKIKKSTPEVYKITSEDKDYIVDGYLIFNEKNNLIIINDIKYHGIAQGTSDNFYKHLKVSLKINDNILFTRNTTSTSKKNEDINILFQEILSNVDHTTDNLQQMKHKFKQSHLELRLQKQDGSLTNKKINLNIEKHFR